MEVESCQGAIRFLPYSTLPVAALFPTRHQTESFSAKREVEACVLPRKQATGAGVEVGRVGSSWGILASPRRMRLSWRGPVHNPLDQDKLQSAKACTWSGHPVSRFFRAQS